MSDAGSGTATAKPARRIEWLDEARAVAALLVVILHSSEITLPIVRERLEPVLGLGQIGVIVFFLVSGYIIPASIRPSAPARDFWIGRALRLLPMYFVAIALYGAYELIRPRLGLFYSPIGQEFDASNVRHVLGNALPWQNIWRVPFLAPPFWTLSVETLFYLFAFLLTRFRLADGFWRAMPYLAPVGILGAIAIGVLRPQTELPSFLYWLCVILIGWGIRRWEAGEGPAPAIGIASFALVVAGLNLPKRPEEYEAIAGPALLLTNLLVGIAIWAAFYTFRRFSEPRADGRRSLLAGIGLVSYSLYLVHSLAMGLASFTKQPIVFVPLVLALSIGISVLTYRMVELPFQNLARRLRKSSAPLASSAAP